MKNCVILLASLLFSNLYGQDYVEYFDGDNGPWADTIHISIDSLSAQVWQIGPPQKAFFHSAATSPNVLITDTINFVPDTTTAEVVATVTHPYLFDFWGVFAVEWVQKFDFTHDSDFGYLEFSMNGGDTWENAFESPYVYNFYGFNTDLISYGPNGELGFSGTDTLWSNVWFCIENTLMDQMGDSLMLKFKIETDSLSSQNEGWMIDNFIVHQTWIHTVEELKQNEYVAIGPNPTQGQVTIRAQKTRSPHVIEDVQILDINGRLLHSFGMLPTKTFIHFPEHLPNGNYLLRIKTNLEEVTKKVVLER